MINEEEFRDVQEELAGMLDSIERLAAMNEALQEALFAALQSTSVNATMFADLIDQTLDQWLMKRRALDSAPALFLRRVRDDVLAIQPALNSGAQPAKPRPALRAVPVSRPTEVAPRDEAEQECAEDARRPAGAVPEQQPPAPRVPLGQSPSETDE